jgi:hypothetical protein
MALALVPGERARMGHANPFGAGHFLYRDIFSLHQPHSAVTPHSGRVGGRVVFPRTGEGRGVAGVAPGGPPP